MTELREYTVTIERSDRDMPDPIDVFAADRDDAIKTIKHIYRSRCRAIISARLKQKHEDWAPRSPSLASPEWNMAADYAINECLAFHGIPVLDAHPLPKEVTR